jgi:hypothetical protein
MTETPYTVRKYDGAFIAHAVAFDLVGTDIDESEAVRKLRTCLAAQIAYGRTRGLTLTKCYFAAPLEYWTTPFRFVELPSDDELKQFKFEAEKP